MLAGTGKQYINHSVLFWDSVKKDEFQVSEENVGKKFLKTCTIVGNS